ncbi:MAG TPA: SRPBCC domain-containing protein [Candidatus Dormibacteraeota bacterium]|nr:SRPBCC domain-containing protein [Candidatus Dormibacteraeota bacterium]
MDEARLVYVMHVAGTPEEVWAALTDPGLTARYWNHHNVSSWARGDPWEHRRLDDGGADIAGAILEADRPRRLAHTWAPAGATVPHSRVAFDIEAATGGTRLTLTHDELPADQFEGTARGWATVLSSLRSTLAAGGGNGEVLWHVTMSLDGFIAGPGDAMDWIFETPPPGPNPTVDEIVRTAGAILAGRRTYDAGRRSDQPAGAGAPYGGAWTGPVFVLTNTPPAGGDRSVTFLSGDIRDAVAAARAAAGGGRVVLFGADVARQCLDAGLVDEVLVRVAPVLLGDGVRLYERAGAARVRLEPVEVGRFGDVTNLRFRVRR